MDLLDKNILIVSPESWQHIFVSKHHYAVHLAKRGNRVYFLNPPSHCSSLLQTEFPGVIQITYKGFWHGLRYMPRTIRRNHIKSIFKSLEKMAKTEFDLIWSFDNSVFFDFDALPKRVYKICHIVDLNQDFQFAQAAKTADICFTPSSYILNKLRLYNSNSHFIHHGLNIDYSDDDVQLPGSGKIKALYFGNLAMPYLDWDIIEKVVLDSHDVDYVFLGSNSSNCDLTLNPMHRAKSRLQNLDNVYFLPQVPSSALLAYMKAADLLIVAYQQKFHRDQTNPHKMMEYLYSGRPIVATFTEEYLQYGEVIQMAKCNEDWPKLFLETVKSINHAFDEEERDRRRHIALANTYENQLHKIGELIDG